MLPVEDEVFKRVSWNAPNTHGNPLNTALNKNVCLESLKKRIEKIFKRTKSGKKRSGQSRNSSAWEETMSDGENGLEGEKCPLRYCLNTRRRQRSEVRECDVPIKPQKFFYLNFSIISVEWPIGLVARSLVCRSIDHTKYCNVERWEFVGQNGTGGTVIQYSGNMTGQVAQPCTELRVT